MYITELEIAGGRIQKNRFCNFLLNLTLLKFSNSQIPKLEAPTGLLGKASISHLTSICLIQPTTSVGLYPNVCLFFFCRRIYFCKRINFFRRIYFCVLTLTVHVPVYTIVSWATNDTLTSSGNLCRKQLEQRPVFF